MRNAFRFGVTAAGVLGALCLAGTASASDGVVAPGEIGFYYSANLTGSYLDLSVSKSDLAGLTFIKSGLSGYGQAVKNNSASVWNRKSQAARVYYGVNYSGPSDYVDPLSWRNLVNTSNDNASFRWI